MKHNQLSNKNNVATVQAVKASSVPIVSSELKNIRSIDISKITDKGKNISSSDGITVSQTKNTTAETIVIARIGTAANDFKNFANSLSKACTGTYKPFGGKTHYVTSLYWNNSDNRTALSSFIASKLSKYNDQWKAVSGHYLYLADTNGNNRNTERKKLRNWCNFLKKVYCEFANLPTVQTADANGQTWYITDGFHQIEVNIAFSAEKATEDYANQQIKESIDASDAETSSENSNNNNILKYGVIALLSIFLVLVVVKIIKKRKK